MQGQVAKWEQAWDAVAEDSSSTLHRAEHRPQQISASQVLAAGRSFRKTSARTYDGKHVTHFGEAAKVLGRFFCLVELAGRFPRTLRAVQLALLEKPKGGHRCIGIFTAYYRVWCRIRRGTARPWEHSQGCRQMLSATAGSSCIDVVWRDAALPHDPLFVWKKAIARMARATTPRA